MSQRDLFKVLMKLVGLVMVILGGIMAMYQLVATIYMRAILADSGMSQFGFDDNWIGAFVLSMASMLAVTLVGLYLFIGGRWILDIAFPYTPNRCRECGYDMFGVKGEVCPECAATKLNQPDPTDSIEVKDLPSTY